MPTGWIPLKPNVDNSGFLYGATMTQGGGFARYFGGLHSAASLATQTIHCFLETPPIASIPAGETLKLLTQARSSGQSGTAKLDVSWASVAPGAGTQPPIGEDPFTIALTSEGAESVTFVWVSSDDYKLKNEKLTLDADTPVVGEIIVFDIRFRGDLVGWPATEILWQFFYGWE